MNDLVLVYLPNFAPAESLRPLLEEVGARAVYDLAMGRCADLEALLETSARPVTVRIDAFTDAVQRVVSRHRDRIDCLIVDARHPAELGPARFAALGCAYAFEVYGVEDVAEAHRFRPRFLVGRGNEGGGAVSSHSTLVLHQILAEKSFVPWVLKGGCDVATARALVQSGAAGVALDAPIWGFEDFADERRDELLRIGESDTMTLPDGRGRHFRFFAKPSSLESRYLKEIAWREPENFARRLKMFAKELLPVGSDAYWARRNVERHGSLENYLRKLVSEMAVPGNPRNRFREGEGIARSLGMRLPLLQGPMARISENAAFARAVAEAGAMPFVALSRLDGKACRAVLDEVKVQGVPYGVGLLGMAVDDGVLDEQLEVLRTHRPRAVVVAAPSPDLVERLRDMDLDAYLHTPTVGSFQTFRDLGARRFVLEGNEAGGHVGLQSSLVLWQNVLDEIGRGAIEPGLEIVFAGGIARPTAVAFLSALVEAHGLADAVVFGLQVGTAYLVTDEIVSTGAMAENYRRLVLEETETLVTGESLNLRVRQVRTDWVVDEIVAFERELERKGLPLRERKERFERQNIGNLSKAVRSVDGATEGSYMAGSALAVLDRPMTLDALHRELCPPSFEGVGERGEARRDEPIAIIGMGMVVPDATTPEGFFQNLLERRYSIREVDPSTWDPEIFYSPDPEAHCKTYSKIGGFVDGFEFDCLEYKIPPRVAASMDLAQKWALVCAKRAMVDAGYWEKDFPREKTSVILANSMGGELNLRNIKAIDLSEFLVHLEREGRAKGLDEETLRALAEAVTERVDVPRITEDTLPGELSNVIAGRIASMLDLSGANFTVDAACASGLAAVWTSVACLRKGDCDLVITGGVDTQMGASSFVKFSAISALSGEGSWPFDARASGFVMGEGCVLFVLKRYSDALRDGDGIYALIRGVGFSSDGKGKAIAAPNSEGQAAALERAYASAGIQARDVAYVEAHGTSTKAGDPVEMETVRRVFADRGPDDPVWLGSVKGNVGHLRAAAGAVGLAKACLAVNQGVIPPQADFREPHEAFREGEEPFAVPRDMVEIERTPFYAGVSSFGFGGTNFHVLVQEPPLNRKALAVRYPRPRFSKRHGRRALRRAFVFPGQSAQYVNMLAELRGDEIFESFLERADKVYEANHGERLSDYIYPSEEVLAEQSHREARELMLQNTIVAQPAILTVSAALAEILRRRGIEADLCFGHSLGEYTALWAGGVLELEDAIDAVTIRGKYMTALAGDDLGTMAFVAADRATVEAVLAEIDGYVICANVNSPTQTIISGATRAVEAAVARFEAEETVCRRLPVSAAFHSEIVKKAAPLFRKGLEAYAFRKARIPVSTNLDGSLYPLAEDTSLGDAEAADRIRDRLAEHVYSSVDFIGQVRRAWELGVREFVEVGPKNILSRLIQDILPGRAFRCWHTNHPKQSTLELVARLEEEIRRPVASSPREIAAKPVTPPPSETAAGAEPRGTDGDDAVSAGGVRDESPAGTARRAELREAVRAVVADVSGYPAEMLEADADFEADLGIDTIKIFEVFSKLRERFPMAKGKRRNMSRLTTIDKVTEYLLDLESKEGGEDDASTASTAGTSAPSVSAGVGLHRLVPYVTLVDSGEPPSAFLGREGTRILLKASGNAAFDDRLRRHLEELGHEVGLYDPAILGAGDEAVTRLVAEFSPPETYLHVVSLRGREETPAAELLATEVTSLLAVGRAFGRSLRRCLVLSDLDGAFGCWDLINDGTRGTPSPVAWVCGALMGALQSLAKDLEGLLVRQVDLPGFADRLDLAELFPSIRFDAAHVVEGMPSREQRVRFSLIPVAAALPEGATPPALRSAVVTGGARGVTSLLVESLLEGTAATIHVLGRSADPGERLPGMPGWGERLRYHSCDVCDGEAVRRVLDEVRRDSGPVDLVLHGAGVESSRSIDRKNAAEIEGVFAPKVRGAWNLVSALAEDERPALVFMSSVAGLFGNHGQCDYAAANALLDLWSPRPELPVLSLAWTAWTELGMAARGPVKTILESSGMDLLAPGPGKELFARALNRFLAAGDRHEVLGVYGGMGEAYGELPFPPVSADAAGGEHSLEAEPHLRDHAIHGRCYFPAVEGLGEFVDAALAAGADGSALVFEDCHFASAIKLSAKETIRTRVQIEGDRLCLVSRKDHLGGKGWSRAHFSARIGRLGDGAAALRADNTEVARIQELLRPEECPVELATTRIGRNEIYHTFFHGPAFQVLDGLERHNLFALEARPNAELLAGTGGLLRRRAMPFLVEAALHTCGLHCLCTAASPTYVLPARIDRMIIRWDRLEGARGHRIWVSYQGRGTSRLDRLTLRQRRYNAVVVDEGGFPLVTLYGVHMMESREVPEHEERFMVTGIPYEIRDLPSCIVHLDDAATLLEDETALRAVLGPDELETLAGLELEKRRREWVGGRLAAKILLRDLLRRRASEEVALVDFAVPGAGKAPVPLAGASLGREARELVAGLTISISHSHRFAVAILGEEGRAVGVDVEKIEPLAPEVTRDFLSPAESELAQDDVERLAMWTLKEACVKATREGLSREPADFEVRNFAFNTKTTIVDRRTGRRFDGVSLRDDAYCYALVRLLD